MRGEFFDFQPTHKLWMYGNHKPQIRGNDNGIWRRIHLIPFSVSIPECQQDRHLAKKLRDELGGILTWAIEGSLSWQREGLNSPQIVRRVTEEYRQEEDIVGQFLTERVVINNNAKIQAAELFRTYKRWADDQGHKFPLTQNKFGRQMTERGIRKQKTNTGAQYLGIGLVAVQQGNLACQF
jgi:putative DNA primase/helicase